MKIKDILKVIDGKLLYGDLDKELENFSKDTRTINQGDVYIGIKGETFDGNTFYKNAFENGADVAIVDNKELNYEIYEGKSIILVNDSVEALGKLAHYKRMQYNIPVIAVTGSVGKTSTRDIIYSVLSKKFNILKTDGNYNNNIGLPLTILRLKDHNMMVLEMGMDKFGEIEYLSNIASPTHAVITNVGTAHIGNLGSRENIMKAKLEIISGMNKDGKLYLNNDNDLLNEHLNEIKEKINVITIGIDNNSDYMATDIILDAFESSFKIDNKDFKINVGGKAFVYNSLMGYSLGKEFNLTDEEIYDALVNIKLTENRLEKLIGKKNETIINDTYNASYDSIKNAVELLSKANYKRKILVLGDVLELGEYDKEMHEKIANEILKYSFDKIILVGNSVKYIKDVLEKNKYNADIYMFQKENETYELLDNMLEKNDIILLKASHGINLINVVNHLKK